MRMKIGNPKPLTKMKFQKLEERLKNAKDRLKSEEISLIETRNGISDLIKAVHKSLLKVDLLDDDEVMNCCTVVVFRCLFAI
ncbi:Uncharacterized protein FWK35_00026382 [Aphis craccivora]|uniref:Uncharacterized protein n=1 Tax=Aphis craccivora TaxID=307492 RepID=A0A6G0VR61_APHCR|nr:Uncharacterized protein FWK35_00026382 [Aphis craccivora]